jgi:hypothetical protein
LFGSPGVGSLRVVAPDLEAGPAHLKSAARQAAGRMRSRSVCPFSLSRLRWIEGGVTMKVSEETIDAVLDSNGQLRLTHQPRVPPGPVRVTIRVAGTVVPQRGLADVIREIAAEQRSRGIPGRSSEDLSSEDDARLAEDTERDRELDAARHGSKSGGPWVLYYLRFFNGPSLRTLGLTTATYAGASAIRGGHTYPTIPPAQPKRYGLADALHLATAIEFGCDMFLTNDNQLANFPDITVVELPWPRPRPRLLRPLSA